MASNFSVQVPEQFHPVFRALLALNDNEFTSLETALRESTPSIYRSALEGAVTSSLELDEDVAKGVVNLLLNLYVVMGRTDATPTSLVNSVVSDLRNTKITPEFEPRDSDWDRFKTNFEKLLHLDRTIGVSAKVFDVMTEHAHVYNNFGSRVLTDLRPIFPKDLSAPPSAGVIIHSLKLAYLEDGEPKEFFVAMDERDVAELKELLDRAETKATLLKQLMGSANIQYIDPRGAKQRGKTDD